MKNLTKKDERQIAKVEHAQGGAGYMFKGELISGEQLGEHCNLFATVTLEPGCEVGYHQHVGTTETYYVTKGSAMYNDNGETYRISEGDVVFCPEGSWHGVINDTDEVYEQVALILKA